MTMLRVVEAETLDGLSEADPDAMRSRRDLQRIHRLMGTRGATVRALRALRPALPVPRPLRILELGAGDASLMLRVAASGVLPHGAELTLIDRQDLVGTATVERYRRLGWKVRSQIADVGDWVAGHGALPLPGRPEVRWDVVVAHLFLHHFDPEPLAALMRAVAERSNGFFASEPRRSALALAGSRLVGLVGANAVTRQDAVLSVHAGFRDRELSALWPAAGGWELKEYSAGLFSHCLQARRTATVATDGR